jgi:hypothetical protein
VVTHAGLCGTAGTTVDLTRIVELTDNNPVGGGGNARANDQIAAIPWGDMLGR